MCEKSNGFTIAKTKRRRIREGVKRFVRVILFDFYDSFELYIGVCRYGVEVVWVWFRLGYDIVLLFLYIVGSSFFWVVFYIVLIYFFFKRVF